MMSTRSVHMWFAFLCVVSLMVPPVKNAPFGFDLWHESDLFKSITCGLFDYCDDEDYEDDCQSTEEPPTLTTTTAATPDATNPSSIKQLNSTPPTPFMTTLTSQD
ncbi:uncharacterized protein [Euwallacea fornicatus]|uniref:uncharacterized protein n=1 Tax=Euwallacea fornicatus TaxID=995702 RepID=UPI003390565C